MLMLVASMASAQLFEGENEIGMFMVENPTAENAEGMSCYMGVPGSVFTYVVLTNPVNQTLGTPIENVGGFEFKIDWPAGIFVTPTIHPSATNFQTAPDFYCGANAPVVGGQVTLISMVIGMFNDNPLEFFITPVSDSTTHSIPGGIAITDADDNFEISEAYTTAGSVDGRDFSAPVFNMFHCDVVPNDDVSFGGVKALFQ